MSMFVCHFDHMRLNRSQHQFTDEYSHSGFCQTYQQSPYDLLVPIFTLQTAGNEEIMVNN